jgi:hypothetical protein
MARRNAFAAILTFPHVDFGATDVGLSNLRYDPARNRAWDFILQELDLMS